MRKVKINLSAISKVGSIVDIGPFRIRLLDNNYNDTGLKIWQTIDVFYLDEVGLQLPNNSIKGGYPTAKGLNNTLMKFFERIPNDILSQIVEVSIPCYIPEKRKIEKVNTRLFLLSATEMCQNNHWMPCEGRPLEFYINNVPEWNDTHWLRTPCLNNVEIDSWGTVGIDGTNYYFYVYRDFAIAPAFCTK